MSEEDIRNTRKESRKEVRDRIKMQRKSMSRDDAAEKSGEIAEKLFGLQDFRNASTTAFYAEKHDDREVCTEEMIKRSMRMQKTMIRRICCPCARTVISLITTILPLRWIPES